MLLYVKCQIKSFERLSSGHDVCGSQVKIYLERNTVNCAKDICLKIGYLSKEAKILLMYFGATLFILFVYFVNDPCFFKD